MGAEGTSFGAPSAYELSNDTKSWLLYVAFHIIILCAVCRASCSFVLYCCLALATCDKPLVSHQLLDQLSRKHILKLTKFRFSFRFVAIFLSVACCIDHPGPFRRPLQAIRGRSFAHQMIQLFRKHNWNPAKCRLIDAVRHCFQEFPVELPSSCWTLQAISFSNNTTDLSSFPIHGALHTIRGCFISVSAMCFF